MMDQYYLRLVLFKF